MLEKIARIRLTRSPRRRWLYGSRQLGDGLTGRRTVRLHASERYHDLQSGSDVPPIPVREAGRGQRARLGSGLQGPLFSNRSGFLRNAGLA
jgi:hypothetical protein